MAERLRMEGAWRRFWPDPAMADNRFTVIGAIVFVVGVRIAFPAPLPIVFLGLVLGSLSALVAMGLVLVYRASRIVNFAQGDLGALAAVLTASLIVGPKWSFFPSVVVGLLAALALGAVVEFVFIRRFAKAPRLILSVATIGLLELTQFGQLALPRLFDFDTAPEPPVPFNFTWNWFPVTFRGGHLLIMIVVPIVVVGLMAFFRYTRAGIAVRAVAESSDRAALLGVPVKRIGTLVWVLAAGLSAIGVLLRMPIQGVSIGGVLGASLLLRALAAAVIGRMENLPRTFGAALLLGYMEQSALFVEGRTIKVYAVLFFVILVGLLVQRKGNVTRADEIGASSWQATKEVRPVPRELRNVPVVRFATLAGGLLIAGFLLTLPAWLDPGQINLFGVGIIFAMAMCSLVILTGWAGQISLGQLAFVAIGASIGGSLAQEGWNFFLILVVCGLAGSVCAIVVGLPALRIQGPFLAVTTLAFALTTGVFFLNAEFFEWLVPDDGQRILRPVLFDKFDLESEYAFYYVLLAAFVLVAASLRSMRNSRTGRILLATRDNTRAAQSYGVNPTRARLSAFALSGFIASFAGALYVFHQHGVSQTVLQTSSNIKLFSMAVIGGLGSIPGAMLGAAYLTFIDYSPFTRLPMTRLFASGTGVLLILMFLRGGLGGLLYDIRDRLLVRVARKHDILVPSLVADTLADDAGGPPSVHVPAPADALLVVRDLDVSYGRTQVLFGVDFFVKRGEIVALLGTNGAGKSTLLSAITGLVPHQQGTITYDDRDLSKATPLQTVEAGMIFMPGGKGVFPTLTVEENITLAGWPFAKKDKEYLARATEQALVYFPILRERWDQKAGNLSGGEQQMLTLAQAFIARPSLLMIDELSLGLAPIIVEQLLDIVRAIHANGTTVILVEQSVNVAITLAERAVFMEKGEIRFDGPTSELLERPDILRAVFLKGAQSVTEEAEAAVATHIRHPFVPSCEHCGHEHKVALRTSGLSVSFGGVRAVSGVDFEIRQGQIIGIIGPNGSGKTTFFDLVSGFLVPTAGRIELAGQDVTSLSPDARAELGLGRSFQDARLFPSMTVRQTIAVALERHLDVRDPIAAAVLSPAVRMAERDVAEQVDALIELMQLEAFADKFVGELSTGTRRIVDIACSLAHDPSVLLLDEPSSGIAQRETEALGPVLLDIRDKTGAALVVVEHDMPLISAISDELVALEFGSVITQGPPHEVLEDPRVVEGYLGGSIEVIERSGPGGAPQANGASTPAKQTPGKKAGVKKAAARKRTSAGV